MSLAEGALALTRWPQCNTFVAKTPAGHRTARPKALLTNGTFLHDALRSERVGVDDVRQAVRASGHGNLAAIAAVVLGQMGR